MLADLARSGLTAEHAKAMRLAPKTKEQSATLALPHRGVGYLIPYLDAKGKPVQFYRYRFLEETRTGFDLINGTKPRRYEQPAKSVSRIYLAPTLASTTKNKYEWEAVQADAARPLVITEGEKKAAAACAAGIPTVGLGGVWNWKAKKLGIDFLPDLDAFAWKDREVTICFDSDAALNENIRQAEDHLAKALTSRGAVVYVARLPMAGSQKQGMDDLLVTKGVDALRDALNAALAWEAGSELRKLNEEVVLVRSTAMIYELATGYYYSRADFNTVFADRITYVGDGDKRRPIPAAKAWFEWPHRAAVNEVVYRPGEPPITDAGELNSWRPATHDGVPLQPRKGDVTPYRDLFALLTAGCTREERRWLEQWIAYPIQCPGTKLYSAVVLWSIAQGNGKSLLAEIIGSLYGANYTKITDAQLEAPFNGWAARKQFILGDDLTAQSNRKLHNKLKVMVTQLSVNINEKYLKAYDQLDTINYVFTSNDANVFLIDNKDRRFFIHEVTSPPAPASFYDSVDRWYRSREGKEALLYYLLNDVDTEGFRPHAPPPFTSAKRAMVNASMSDVDQLIQDLIADPDSYLVSEGIASGGDLITGPELRGLIARKVEDFRMNESTIGRKMKEAGCPAIMPSDITSPLGIVRIGNGQRVKFYPLRNVDKWAHATADQLRQHFAKFRKGQRA